MSARADAAILRAPQARDRSRVAQIIRATGVFHLDEEMVALEVFDGAVNQPGVDYCALGAYAADGSLSGFACYGPTPCTAATWDLYWIAVDPSAYRQGTGRALMAACEAEIAARGGRLIVVETSSRADYAPTRAFYLAIGYEAAAQIQGYYAPSDDLIVFTKRMVPSPSENPHG